ncbi:MAG: sugar phosphate isomerase/epimerase family protein [Fimbriimonadales bacterium]
MKLSANCYTVRDLIAKDLWGTLAALRGLGLDYIEIGGLYGVSAKEFREGVDKLGLKISANHVALDQLENQMDQVIEDNRILGVQCIVLPWIDKQFYERGWAMAAKKLEPFGARLRDEGFIFAYHNHSFEFEPENGRPGLDVFYEAADPHLVGAQIDTYWVAYGGGDTAAYIRKLEGRVTQCHFKDGKIGGSEPHFLEVGQGDLNWDDIIAACHESDVKFVSIELDECPHEPIESVRMSAEFLRGKGITE